jgi:hypothetical protein
MTLRTRSIRNRLEHLEARRKVAGAPIGVQADATAAIAEYLENLREWIRSESPRGDSAGGDLQALPRNPIGTPVKWTVSDYRMMIAGAEKADQESRSCP